MADNTEHEAKRPLTLRPSGGAGGRLELRKPTEISQVRQSFPHGRSCEGAKQPGCMYRRSP
jgi:hypothetical protein